MKSLFLFSLVCLSLLTSSCKKDDNDPVAIDGNWYFRANIDNDSVNFTDGVDRYINAYDLDSLLDGSGFKTYVASTMFDPFDTYDASADISFGMNLFPNYPTYEEFKTIFPLGSVTYGTERRIPNQNGVVVDFFAYDANANNTLWSSALGSQSGSSFTIVSVDFSDEGNYSYFAHVTATFNCTLYDGNGNSKILKNGKIEYDYWYEKE